MRGLAAGILCLGLVGAAWAGWSWVSPPDPIVPEEGVVVAAPTTSAPSAGATPTLLPGSPAPATGAAASTSAPAAGGSTVDGTVAEQPLHPATATRVLRFEAPSAGYASDVGTMAIANTGAIKPPDFQHLWWIRDRGVIPSSPATDTAYLACHTDAKKAVSAVPCNRVSLENTPVGSTITVTTDAETLTYRVVQSRKILRDDFAHDDEVWGVRPGRLVWVSCYLADGRRSEFNLVVIAELVKP